MPKQKKDPFKGARILYSPYRSNRDQSKYNHKMYAKKSKGVNKNFVKYGTLFEVDEDDSDFQIGATGAGLSLQSKRIKRRTAHTFRTADLALNRILTSLAENMLSYLNAQGFPGLAEVQIGWITELDVRGGA